MIETYKHFHTYDNNTLSKSFRPRTRPSRSHKYQIHPIKALDGERGVHKNSFYCRIVDLWNELPSTVAEAPTLNAFKNRLDTHWKDSPLMYDHCWTTNADAVEEEE